MRPTIAIHAAWLSLILLAPAAPAAGPAATQAPAREVRADLASVKGPHRTVFQFSVGAGRANEGLRADWQEQLRIVKRACGFRYLRLHGLFHDDMGVYFESRAGQPIYNWQYVDRLHDFLLSIGVRPFVELSFMPKALASGEATVFWWKGNITPPKSYEKWGDLIQAFVRHEIERYGQDEVTQWYFEVWNEPNLNFFFTGSQDEYFQLYDTTARAIKTVCPTCRVGGPATAGNAWVSEMIAHCQKAGVPLDFVSTHDYSITKGFFDSTGEQATIFDRSPRAITANVLESRRRIAESAMPSLELHYTEWSSSYTPSDPIHDSYQQAAFILDKIKGTEEAATSMSYWTFTDIFEEAGPRATPFHGGFGLLNYQDIQKPAFYAFQFLAQLGETELVSSDPASFVCASRDGGVQVLLWDYTITYPGEPVTDQQYFKQDLPAAPKGKAQVSLKGVKPGSYWLEVFRVGYRTNDAYATYLDLGSPAQLTPAQVEAIKGQNDGSPSVREVVKVGADGRFERRLDLRENDVYLLKLRSVR